MKMKWLKKKCKKKDQINFIEPRIIEDLPEPEDWENDDVPLFKSDRFEIIMKIQIRILGFKKWKSHRFLF